MATEKRLIDANAFWNLLQQAVYDVFTAHEHDGKLTGTASVGYYTETIQEVLKRTPTVDAVEVVHGRWIPVVTYEVCSHCGFEINRGERIREFFLVDNQHCRWCGAKMDGDGNA